MSSINKMVGGVLVALLALGGLSACGQVKADVSCKNAAFDVPKTISGITEAERKVEKSAGTPGEKSAKAELKTLREQLEQLEACDVKTASDSVEKEAATWVQLMYSNFKGVDETPKEIENYQPEVDLTEVHFYNQEDDKESKTAFGPHMGKTPETVSIALVERLYRDPALALDVARRRGIEKFKAEDQAAKVRELADGPFEDRRALANKILGWYANPDLELSLKNYEGKHGSNDMSRNGATSNVVSDKDSLVLEAKDQATGKVKSRDRTNCGLQDFVLTKLPPGEECPPGWPGEPPNCLEPKDPAEHPANTGNGPSDQWDPAPPVTEEPSEPGGGQPPATYTPPPPPPDPEPTPRPSEPPPNEGGGEDDPVTPDPDDPDDPGCDPRICG